MEDIVKCTLHSKTSSKSPLNILDLSPVCAPYDWSVFCSPFSFLILSPFLTTASCTVLLKCKWINFHHSTPWLMMNETKILPWDSSSLWNIFWHGHSLLLLVLWKPQAYSRIINLPLCYINNTKKHILVPFLLTTLWFLCPSTTCTWERKQEKEISKD